MRQNRSEREAHGHRERNVTKAARDPVCGMTVDTERALSAPFQEETFFFCSEYCRNLFLSGPGPYAQAGGKGAT